MEVQKVLRKYLDRGVHAQDCVEGFRLARKLVNPKPVLRGKMEADMDSKLVGKCAALHPIFFATLILAIEKSDKRMASLDPKNIDRMIELNIESLQNNIKFKKLAEALPGLKENQLDQARNRISRLAKTCDFWDVEMLLPRGHGNIPGDYFNDLWGSYAKNTALLQ